MDISEDLLLSLFENDEDIYENQTEEDVHYNVIYDLRSNIAEESSKTLSELTQSEAKVEFTLEANKRLTDENESLRERLRQLLLRQEPLETETKLQKESLAKIQTELRISLDQHAAALQHSRQLSLLIEDRDGTISKLRETVDELKDNAKDLKKEQNTSSFKTKALIKENLKNINHSIKLAELLNEHNLLPLHYKRTLLKKWRKQVDSKKGNDGELLEQVALSPDGVNSVCSLDTGIESEIFSDSEDSEDDNCDDRKTPPCGEETIRNDDNSDLTLLFPHESVTDKKPLIEETAVKVFKQEEKVSWHSTPNESILVCSVEKSTETSKEVSTVNQVKDSDSDDEEVSLFLASCVKLPSFLTSLPPTPIQEIRCSLADAATSPVLKTNSVSVGENKAMLFTRNGEAQTDITLSRALTVMCSQETQTAETLTSSEETHKARTFTRSEETVHPEDEQEVEEFSSYMRYFVRHKYRQNIDEKEEVIRTGRSEPKQLFASLNLGSEPSSSLKSSHSLDSSDFRGRHSSSSSEEEMLTHNSGSEPKQPSAIMNIRSKPSSRIISSLNLGKRKKNAKDNLYNRVDQSSPKIQPNSHSNNNGDPKYTRRKINIRNGSAGYPTAYMSPDYPKPAGENISRVLPHTGEQKFSTSNEYRKVGKRKINESDSDRISSSSSDENVGHSKRPKFCCRSGKFAKMAQEWSRQQSCRDPTWMPCLTLLASDVFGCNSKLVPTSSGRSHHCSVSCSRRIRKRTLQRKRRQQRLMRKQIEASKKSWLSELSQKSLVQDVSNANKTSVIMQGGNGSSTSDKHISKNASMLAKSEEAPLLKEYLPDHDLEIPTHPNDHISDINDNYDELLGVQQIVNRTLVSPVTRSVGTSQPVPTKKYPECNVSPINISENSNLNQSSSVVYPKSGLRANDFHKTHSGEIQFLGGDSDSQPATLPVPARKDPMCNISPTTVSKKTNFHQSPFLFGDSKLATSPVPAKNDPLSYIPPITISKNPPCYQSSSSVYQKSGSKANDVQKRDSGEIQLVYGDSQPPSSPVPVCPKSSSKANPVLKHLHREIEFLSDDSQPIISPYLDTPPKPTTSSASMKGFGVEFCSPNSSSPSPIRVKWSEDKELLVKKGGPKRSSLFSNSPSPKAFGTKFCSPISSSLSPASLRSTENRRLATKKAQIVETNKRLFGSDSSMETSFNKAMSDGTSNSKEIFGSDLESISDSDEDELPQVPSEQSVKETVPSESISTDSELTLKSNGKLNVTCSKSGNKEESTSGTSDIPLSSLIRRIAHKPKDTSSGTNKKVLIREEQESTLPDDVLTPKVPPPKYSIPAAYKKPPKKMSKALVQEKVMAECDTKVPDLDITTSAADKDVYNEHSYATASEPSMAVVDNTAGHKGVTNPVLKPLQAQPTPKIDSLRVLPGLKFRSAAGKVEKTVMDSEETKQLEPEGSNTTPSSQNISIRKRKCIKQNVCESSYKPQITDSDVKPEVPSAPILNTSDISPSSPKTVPSPLCEPAVIPVIPMVQCKDNPKEYPLPLLSGTHHHITKILQLAMAMNKREFLARQFTKSKGFVEVKAARKKAAYPTLEAYLAHDLNLEATVQELACVSDHMIVIWAMVKSVRELEPSTKETAAESGPLSSNLQRVLKLALTLHEVGQQWRPLLGDLLLHIEYEMFRLGHSPSFELAENLTLFYAALCKNFGMARPMLNFCLMALYSFKFKAHGVIYSALTVYPEFLPVKLLGNDNLLMNCMVYLLYHHIPSIYSRLYKVNGLKNLLKNTYGYDSNIPAPHDFLKFCINKLKGGNPDAVTAIILLAKRKEWQWTLKHVLNGHLEPILQEWKQGKVTEFVAMQTVKIIGFILKCFPKNAPLSKAKIRTTFTTFGKLLLKNNCSHAFQETVASALICLVRFNSEEVTEILSKWQPKKPASDELLERFQVLIRTQSHRRWRSYILSINPPVDSQVGQQVADQNEVLT